MWRGRPQLIASRMENSAGTDQMTCPYVASPESKGRSYWQTYMVVTMGITRHHELSLARRSAAGSTGPQHSATPLSW